MLRTTPHIEEERHPPHVDAEILADANEALAMWETDKEKELIDDTQWEGRVKKLSSLIPPILFCPAPVIELGAQGLFTDKTPI